MTSLNGIMHASESFPPYPTGPAPTFSTRMTRSNTLLSVDESDEDAQFDEIRNKLVAATDFATHALPKCLDIIADCTKLAVDRGASEADIALYRIIGERCQAARDASEALKRRLLDMRLKDPEIKMDLEFWQLCTSFTRVSSTAFP